MKDYLIVVDANWPSGARLALEDARKLSKKPVKYVFDTHHHGDHSYGNPVWTQAGSITLAYKGVGTGANRALIEWAAASDFEFDRRDVPKGDSFACRYEAYLTDPKVEPHKKRWKIELAFKLAS